MSDFPILFGLRHQWVDLSLTSTTKVNYATGSWPLSEFTGDRGDPRVGAQGYPPFPPPLFPYPTPGCSRCCECSAGIPSGSHCGWDCASNSWLVPLTLPSGSFWGLIYPPGLFCTTCLRLCLNLFALVSTGWCNKNSRDWVVQATVISPCSGGEKLKVKLLAW